MRSFLTRTRSLLLAAMSLALAATAQADTPQLINISYVQSPFNLQLMVMRQQGALEEEFAADGIEIVWHNITSGAHQAQAMAARALDIGGVMNTTSILLANAGGNPVQIAAAVSRPLNTFAILGRPGGPTTIGELRGARVAGPRGTVLHQILAAALASEGMTLDDVDFLGMDLPAAQTALISGQVDAALLAASLKIRAEEAGSSVITTADGLVTPLLVMGVRASFAADHPDLLARIVQVHRDTTAWIANHPAEAIAIGAEVQGIALADAERLAAWAGFADRLVPSDLDAIAADLAFLTANGMLEGGVDIPALLLPGAMAE